VVPLFNTSFSGLVITVDDSPGLDGGRVRDVEGKCRMIGKVGGEYPCHDGLGCFRAKGGADVDGVGGLNMSIWVRVGGEEERE
jgi:hypothetical protein